MRIASTASLLIMSLLASAAAADEMITVVAERGTLVARFTVGDATCELKDDLIVCAPRRQQPDIATPLAAR